MRKEGGRCGCHFDGLDEADTMVREGGREGGREEGRLDHKIILLILFSSFRSFYSYINSSSKALSVW